MSVAPQTNSFSTNFLSGVLGSWISLSILYPIEHARNRQSINLQKTTKSILGNIMETVSKQGFRSLYTGSLISMYGVAIFRGTYFGIFDTFKGSKSGFERWSVAYLSSLAAIMLTYPSDTIRRRLICCNK